MTVAALQTLATNIQTLVEASGLDCQEVGYQVTAGQPAQPTGNCALVSVWASQAFNAANSMFHEDSPCLVVRGLQMHWRLDLCFTESEQDRTAAEHLETATCLYGLADVIWCGLNLKAAEGIWGRCADVQIDPLSYNEASGGLVSAESGIRIQDDCPTPNAPEDIVGALAPVEEGGDFG